MSILCILYSRVVWYAHFACLLALQPTTTATNRLQQAESFGRRPCRSSVCSFHPTLFPAARHRRSRPCNRQWTRSSSGSNSSGGKCLSQHQVLVNSLDAHVGSNSRGSGCSTDTKRPCLGPVTGGNVFILIFTWLRTQLMPLGVTTCAAVTTAARTTRWRGRWWKNK